MIGYGRLFVDRRFPQNSQRVKSTLIRDNS